MDPVTAVGLASSILSFVSFAGQLVKTAAKISQYGSLEENVVIERDINRTNEFRSRLIFPHGTTSDGNKRTLQVLLEESEEASTELLKILEKMKAPTGSGLRVARKVVKASFKTLYYESDRKDLEDRLSRLETTATMVLAQLARESAQVSALKAEEQVAKLEDLAQITTELKKLGSSQHELGEKTQQAIKEMIDGQIAAANKIRTKRVLDSLVYENMADRNKSIEDSLFAIQSGSGERRNAFTLIFGDSESEADEETDEETDADMDLEEATAVTEASNRFLGWLSSPEGGIFHIAGKPGSGKSTLMKFLFDHERTRKELTRWAERERSNSQLIMVDFFFSALTGGLQEQFDGLRRTLLYQILHERPDVVPDILDGPWKRSASAVEREISIRPDEMTTALSNIICDGRIPGISLCLFIDGLDELREPSMLDTIDLVNQLRQWAPSTQKNVKMCVASRVEFPFMDHFDPDKRFLLHEITRYDMQRFVGNRLPEGHEAIPPAVRRELIYHIPRKAEGVFLWVSLVVKSIRQEISGGVSLDTNSDILASFPPGLENLMDRILTSVPKKWSIQLHHIIKISAVMYSFDSGGFSLLAYSFLDDFEMDPRFALKESFPGRQENENPTLAKLNKAKGMLVHRFKGLLEVTSFCCEPTVKVIHRSVWEYLHVKSSDICPDFDAVDATSYLMLGELVWLSKLGDCELPRERGFKFEDLPRTIHQLRFKHNCDSPPYDILGYLQATTEETLEKQLHPGKTGPLSLFLYDVSQDHFAPVAGRQIVPGSRETDDGSDSLDGILLTFTPIHANIFAGDYSFGMHRLKYNPPMAFSTFMSIIYTIHARYCYLDGPDHESGQQLSSVNHVPELSEGVTFLKLLLSENQHHTKTTTDFLPRLSRQWQWPVGIEPTVWHGFLMANFLPRVLRLDLGSGLAWSTNTAHAVNFAIILECFLRSGVDPSVWIHVTLNKPEADEKLHTMDSVRFQFNTSSESMQAVFRHNEIHYDYRPIFLSAKSKLCSHGWSLRDWIETMPEDIPNKTTILRLLDHSTSTTSTRPTTAASVDIATLPTAPLGHDNPETPAPPENAFDHCIPALPTLETTTIGYSPVLVLCQYPLPAPDSLTLH